MKYLQSFKPFQIIASLANPNNHNKNKEHLETTSLTLESEQAQQQPTTYEDAETFLLGVGQMVREEMKQADAVRRKVDLFQRVQVEPHYLEETPLAKLLSFEFHLGTDAFLERTETLHQQVIELNSTVREVLRGKAEFVHEYFQQLDQTCKRMDTLLAKVASLRHSLNRLREGNELSIWHLLTRKRILKQKVHLLRKVKEKNQAVFVQISNIDQAFATEQPRVRLYRKLNSLTELQRSNYVATFRAKLVSTCKNNKRLVEEGLIKWVDGQLSQKQVQKLAFMIYFMEREDVYRDHEIKVDYSLVDSHRLRQEITKIFQWQRFHYINDASTRERIHEFLHFLLKRIQ